MSDGLFTPHTPVDTAAASSPTDAALLPDAAPSLSDVLHALNRAADAQADANALLSQAYDLLGRLEDRIPEDPR